MYTYCTPDALKPCYMGRKSMQIRSNRVLKFPSESRIAFQSTPLYLSRLSKPPALNFDKSVRSNGLFHRKCQLRYGR